MLAVAWSTIMCICTYIGYVLHNAQAAWYGGIDTFYIIEKCFWKVVFPSCIVD